MSTKATIAHGDDFHVYQEMFEGDTVYLQIEEHGGYLKVEGQTLTISLPPSLLDKIARGWLDNREKFDIEPNMD